MMLHFDISIYVNENWTQCTPKLTKMRCRVLMYLSNIHYLCRLMSIGRCHNRNIFWWNTKSDYAMLIFCLITFITVIFQKMWMSQVFFISATFFISVQQNTLLDKFLEIIVCHVKHTHIYFVTYKLCYDCIKTKRVVAAFLLSVCIFINNQSSLIHDIHF